jgi:hypothetical protein
MEYVWTVARICGPALTLSGLGLSVARFDKIAVARVFFWASAIVLGVSDLTCQLTTLDPIWFRISMGSSVGVAIPIIYPMIFEWLLELQTTINAIGRIAIGLIVFVGAPEAARLINGGAFAQAPASPETPSGPTPPTVQQYNNGSPNLNVPGSGNQFYFNPTLPSASPHRRASSVYQDNTHYGEVIGVKVDELSGKVYIDRLNFNEGFIPHNEFEQDDLKLEMVSRVNEIRDMGPNGTTISLFNVICKITGHVK